MILWAIVPVKPLGRGKSRLAEVLSREERAKLSTAMLTHTLEVLSGVDEIEGTVVVSRDRRALDMAQALGAEPLSERRTASLNAALEQATQVIRAYGAEGALVLPADLPFVDVTDLRVLIKRAQSPPVVAIAPDQHGRGTNAMLVAPPGTLEYEFGPDSLDRHIRAAEQAGARVVICDLSALSLDLDAPDDLAIYSSRSATLKEH